MSENYKLLMKKIKENSEEKKFVDINNRIDKILEKSSNKKVTLESLISTFEAHSNVGPYFASVAIAYAVLIGAIAVLPVEWVKGFASFILLIMTLVLAGLSIQTNKRNIHRTFVLCALRFRYEKECVDCGQVMETEKVLTEDKKYKEYIVKVEMKS